MRETKIERTARFFSRMSDLEFSYSEAQSLRRIELTLQRWSEKECNGDIQRDEATGQAYRHYGHNGPGPFLTVKTADREKGALARLAKIMAKHPELWSYHQTDPRGCALYVGRFTDLQRAWQSGDVTGETIAQHHTRGVAVCI